MKIILVERDGRAMTLYCITSFSRATVENVTERPRCNEEIISIFSSATYFPLCVVFFPTTKNNHLVSYIPLKTIFKKDCYSNI